MAARVPATSRPISCESFSPCMFRSATSDHLNDILVIHLDKDTNEREEILICKEIFHI
ncbi:hypothetical protein HanXRQr2_Chr13g0578481 [Helianthus annuus]|uniref:Uncharacterized protein n=1 Tax=Helianthus annuus TaxID=4232 RepID=A0A9K3EGA8_HELAN|nr:hypothetical protein HanXRQr2_Chr13g0578481 [Helianthus annuus]KAJ0848385.1 hypothetical protein HanPSC8_Chr13g0556651 [Helianthus annuus]